MLNIKSLIISALASFALLFTLSPAFVGAQTPKDDIQAGACNAAGQSNCNTKTATSSLNKTIRQIINILSIIAGVIAVIMLIVGGVRYVTSAGNDQAVAGAKRTIMYALIGLIIVALAQIIVRYVLRSLFT